jgi:DNA-binding transcriptional LysR family regulator
MGEVVTRYLAAHPHVDIDVSLDDRYIDLQSNAIDVAIRIGRLPDSQLIARRLAPCRMVMCAAPAFVARTGMPATSDDLRGTPRLAFSEAVTAGEWTLLDEHERRHVIDGPLRMRANNMQMLTAAALAGMGIAYGPTFVFGEHIEAGRLVALLPGFRAPELSIHAVYPSARYVPSRVRLFIDYLVDAFGDDPAWDKFIAR